jgi:hypothetical protein
MNAPQRKQQAIESVKALYEWRPALYRRTGEALLHLQAAGEERPRFAYKAHDLMNLARAAGILKERAKRAPALLYLCVQLARDVPAADLTLYKKHGLLVDHVRLVLRALGRQGQPKARARIRASIRERLQQSGTQGFKTFIRQLSAAQAPKA